MILSLTIFYSVITSLFFNAFNYPITNYSPLWYLECFVFITFLIEIITNFLKLPNIQDEKAFKLASTYTAIAKKYFVSG
jgi:hypothetical protein